MARSHFDFSQANWRKSSYSNSSGGDCVEIAIGLPGRVPIRDSKLTAGPTLVFPATAWAPFITAVAANVPTT
ncbi:DUF397 domain-containing protein [Streptomyces sp. Je 1-369]|uniref:DUF397 domain-containing protein n=1 Tax=Streptomyces sp. Je 1-369 TaxID=2966192 RepID=UPI0022869767|nr:DUF397 domain-containing protein [Streptomyces sp. Je 1-369]WAL95914.1 DUF397 domain-containing protein [Streptomyces sp. Je 1-369]